MCQGVECFRRAVGRMVVDHNDVEVEACVLSKRTLHGVGDGAMAVANGYDDRGSHGKSLFVGFRQFVDFVGSQPSTDLFEMNRADTLTLQLGFACGGVDIVKLSLAALAEVGLGFGVEHFAQMEDVALPAQTQAKCIRRSIAIACIALFFNKTFNPCGTHQPKSAKIKIVSDASRRVVNHRMRLGVAFFGFIAVGIDHHGAGVFGRLYESLDTAVAEGQCGRFEIKQGIARFESFCRSAHKAH